ncbi:hypothetical protein Y032_0679g1465 [Ancylostoma ceylanicum]|uniref:Uncharacterized protein n=1 Tax=Ancylostoma ceylanicum TaxID=53326 RepID=A0A016WHH1_9BILA|nr:hypothetical protein Y032_0679g1465 [Ancylostoma ceylanicum]
MIAVQTHNCGVLHVYVQGSLEERNGKTIILTCHDVGTNYKTFVRFVNHPSMADVKNKSIFLHVCVPGQEDNAADYIGEYVAQCLFILPLPTLSAKSSRKKCGLCSVLPN